MKVASSFRMETMPRLSGLDLARGLLRSGYRLTGNAGGYLLLERGSRAVIVPFVDELEPTLLRFLTLAAGVLPRHLVAVLQAPGPGFDTRAPSRISARSAGSRANKGSAADLSSRADAITPGRGAVGGSQTRGIRRRRPANPALPIGPQAGRA
jgi:hypothetical protein